MVCNQDKIKAAEIAALEQAALSTCLKRKVGAVITDADYNIKVIGHNFSTDGGPCEDSAGATKANVVHAEIAAINRWPIAAPQPQAIFVTQPPCNECLLAIKGAGIEEIHIVESFMKFDNEKLRYDLIPTSWHEGDAEILTHGAKKYKPQNWREVDDLGRYVAAAERHLMGLRKALETKDMSLLYDKDSGLHHMKHLRTNAGFLLTLTENMKDED